MARRPAADKPRFSRAFDAKVGLRVEAVGLLDTKPVKVLDCFAGPGKIWSAVANQVPVQVDSVEIDPTVAAPGTTIGDNLDVLRSRDLDRYDLIDLDAFGWPDEQLDVISWRRRSRLPVLTVTCAGTEIGRLPNLVRDAAGIPSSWPVGPTVRQALDFWTLFVASRGYRVHRRLTGRRRGGAWIAYEILIPA